MVKTVIESALDLLSKRSLTTTEVILRLKKKGYNTEEIRECINRLKQWGYLNDYSYAVEFCNIYSNREPKQKIYYRLVRRGIETTIIDEVIKKAYSHEQEKELCFRLAKKLWESEKDLWYKKYRNQNQYKGISESVAIKNKVGNKLWRKGFNFDTINYCLEEIDRSG